MTTAINRRSTAVPRVIGTLIMAVVMALWATPASATAQSPRTSSGMERAYTEVDRQPSAPAASGHWEYAGTYFSGVVCLIAGSTSGRAYYCQYNFPVQFVLYFWVDDA